MEDKEQFTVFTSDDGVQIRTSMNNSVLEIFDSLTNQWKPMTPLSTDTPDESTARVNGRKRKLSNSAETAPALKRKKLSFTDLFPDLINHILSFRHYWKAEELKDIKEMFGRFSDGSIHLLYVNIQVDELEDWSSVGHILAYARIFDVWCPVSKSVLNRFHIICPRLERVNFWIWNDFELSDIQAIISKIWMLRIGESNLPYLDQLKHIKHLWIHDLQVKSDSIREIIHGLCCHGLHFCNLLITDEKPFPVDALKNHAHIRGIELYCNNFDEYSIKSEDIVEMKGITAFQARLKTDQFKLLAANQELKSLAIYTLSEEILETLREMKGLRFIEIYLHRSDIRWLSELVKMGTGINQIDLMCWHNGEEEFFSVEDAVEIALAFQHTDILVRAPT